MNPNVNIYNFLQKATQIRERARSDRVALVTSSTFSTFPLMLPSSEAMRWSEA